MGLKTKLAHLNVELHTLAMKAKALGEALANYRCDAELIDQGDIWLGYGTLIREIGQELEAWSRLVDEAAIKEQKGENHD